MASSSSVTRITPICAVMAEPERPAIKIAASTGPSSRISEIPRILTMNASAPNCLSCWEIRYASTTPIKKPTNAVIGSAVAPMLYRWPDKSRQGPSCGCRASRIRSSSSWPTSWTSPLVWSQALSRRRPSTATGSSQPGRGLTGGAIANFSTDAISARWFGSMVRLSGHWRPHWFHNTCAPRKSSLSMPLKSQGVSAWAFRLLSCAVTAFHTGGAVRSAAVQAPSTASALCGASTCSMRGMGDVMARRWRCGRKLRKKRTGEQAKTLNRTSSNPNERSKISCRTRGAASGGTH